MKKNKQRHRDLLCNAENISFGITVNIFYPVINYSLHNKHFQDFLSEKYLSKF